MKPKQILLFTFYKTLHFLCFPSSAMDGHKNEKNQVFRSFIYGFLFSIFLCLFPLFLPWATSYRNRIFSIYFPFVGQYDAKPASLFLLGSIIIFFLVLESKLSPSTEPSPFDFYEECTDQSNCLLCRSVSVTSLTSVSDEEEEVENEEEEELSRKCDDFIAQENMRRKIEEKNLAGAK